MKYKLVTSHQGVTSIPVISIAQDKINVTRDFTGDIIVSPSTNPAYNLTAGYTAILGNKNVGTLVVKKVIPSTPFQTRSQPLLVTSIPQVLKLSLVRSSASSPMLNLVAPRQRT